MSTLSPERVHETQLGDGDHDKFAHYVLKEKLGDAYVFGTPVQALCGKMWVPFGDPQKHPVCPECKELMEMGPEGRMEFFNKRSQGD